MRGNRTLVLFLVFTLICALRYYLESRPKQKAAQIDRTSVSAAITPSPPQDVEVPLARTPAARSFAPIFAHASKDAGKKEEPWERCNRELQLLKEDPERNQEFLAYREKLPYGAWLWDSKQKPPEGRRSGKRTNYESLSAALAIDGQLYDRNQSQDSKRALRMLRRLNRKDPQNSAPGMFAAVILFREGRAAEARALLNQLDATTSHFSTYSEEFSKSLLLAAETPAQLMEAGLLLASAPVPDYAEFNAVMKELAPSGLLRQMTANGMDNRKAIPDVEWSQMQYIIGFQMLNRRNEASGLRNPAGMLEYKSAFAPEADSTLEYKAYEESCDLEALRPYLLRLRDRLQRQ